MNLQKADLLFCDGADSFLQSGFWGCFKARFGWEALAFRAVWCNAVPPDGEKLSGIEKSLLVLRRRLAPGFALAYVPWGPELPGINADVYDDRETAVRELAASLRKLLPKDTVFIRFDFPWYSTEENPPSQLSPFVRSQADVQTPVTVLIDISQPMESVVEQMKPKWRYNSRLALKRGVTIHRAGGEEIDVFYGLLKETARRDGIAIHGVDYYRALFESAGTGTAKIGDVNDYPGQKPDIRLYLAEHEGEALAGIVTLFRGPKAVYLYGASSGNKRNLMAPYALQLRAMEDAKASGCIEYDLYGIPPNSNPSHPMAGLYRFKTGFGGKIIHRPGCWDYPCYNLLYRVYFFMEKIRKWILNRKKR